MSSEIRVLSQKWKDKKIDASDLIAFSLEASAKKKRQQQTPISDGNKENQSGNLEITNSNSKRLKGIATKINFDFSKNGRFNDNATQENITLSPNHTFTGSNENDNNNGNTNSNGNNGTVSIGEMLINNIREQENQSHKDTVDTFVMHDYENEQSGHDHDYDQDERDDNGALLNWTQVDEESLMKQRERAGTAVTFQFLQLLNHGKEAQLTQLNGIGAKRAKTILAKREEGIVFTSLSMLATIGIAERSIDTFLSKNLHHFVSLSKESSIQY